MSQSPIQSLTERQRMVLMSHVQQGLFNPEIVANLFVNPRPMFLSTELSEDDVQNISEFLSSVDGLKQGQLASSSDFVDVDVTSIDARLSDKQVTILKCAIEQALTSVDALQDFFWQFALKLSSEWLKW